MQPSIPRALTTLSSARLHLHPLRQSLLQSIPKRYGPMSLATVPASVLETTKSQTVPLPLGPASPLPTLQPAGPAASQSPQPVARYKRWTVVEWPPQIRVRGGLSSQRAPHGIGKEKNNGRIKRLRICRICHSQLRKRIHIHAHTQTPGHAHNICTHTHT